MKELIYEAHTGVSTEAPWNTMPAFRTSVAQGYKMIELDLGVTKDKKLVVLHDETINSVARTREGARLSEDVYINDITYEEALEYDFGISFSKKFKGTKIALFDDVIELAKKNGIKLKIDNKYERFTDEELDVLIDAVKKSEGASQLTCKYIGQAKMAKERLGDCEIHYDGEVSEEILKELSKLYDKDKMTVWAGIPSPKTWWVDRKMPVEDLCELIKKYAKLGIWILSDDEQLEKAKLLGADVIETNGAVKPPINLGMIADMHTHSDNSHDAKSRVCEMAERKAASGVSVMAVTDHMDMEFCRSIDVFAVAEKSHRDAAAANGDDIRVLTGLEMGEAIWEPEEADRLIDEHTCDVVIGSVHAVRYKDMTTPYAQINFDELSDEVIYEFLNQYFDDYEYMVRNTNCDIAAHITSPMRYIWKKRVLDLGRYDDRIAEIFRYMIRKGIAMELNMSCIISEEEYAYYRKLLKMYRELGGYLITIGSDHHMAIGDKSCYEGVYNLVKEMGFKNIYYFENRMAIQCSIGE